MRYNNYHKHTYYSNLRTLDCIVSPEEYMQRAVELGHTAYFTTEHGFQGNLFEAQTLCEKYKLKLIYGVEAYYVDDICDKTDRRSFHLILIGLTEKARYEINRILSIANTDGFYYKPRIGLKELLSLTPTETIVTTACVAGRMFKPKSITTTEEIVGWEEVEELIDDHDPDAGTRKRNKPIYKTEIEGPDSWYTDFFVPVKNHFKDNFYLEVQAHNEPSQIEYNKKILEVARRTNTKIIHACDSHYIYPKDSRKRDLFLSAKGMRYEEETNFILDYPSYDEIVQRYRTQGVLTEEEAIQAINNTLIFDNAEPIYTDKEFKIPLVPNQFIQEELGPGYTNDNNDKVLREIIGRAFQKELRAGKIKPENKEKYMKAIVDEVETVRQCGMASYFVLDHIVVQRAVQKYGAVLTRSGRGSAVSFVINKFLGLTEVDRIKAPVTLYPSRFMSAERILSSRSLPDIDLNFADVKPVIQASKDVLGEDGIYYMIAYKPLQRSSAFRLYCKAIGQPIEAYDEVAKFLAVKGNTDEMFCEEYPSWANVLEASKIFRGVIESVAPSPCSFLLSNDHISEKIGLIKVGNEICCALDGYNCDVYKFLKNDYLTVSVYSLINETYKLIGRPIDDIGTLVNNCDKKVWDIYANGLTTTINQTDSDMGKQLIMKYKPTNLAELSAWVAAIRPGFASLLKYFLDRTGYSTGVPELDNILTDSYHYMMYQENIMSFLVWLGIEEKGTYDIIKKISKKKFTEEELTNLKNVLRENWIKKVGSVDFFEENWRTVQDAAHYSFNASHALSVAIDSLYGAYLKAHYPLEYFTVALSLYSDDMTRTANLTKELSYFNITLQQARFGKSGAYYTMDKEAQTIYKGVASIKFCNAQIADELMALSKNHYATFIDLLDDIEEKTSVNSKQLNILIGLNFFEQFGANRYLQMVAKLYDDFHAIKQIKKSNLEHLYNCWHITEDMVRQCAGKETEKIFKDLNTKALMNFVLPEIPNQPLSVVDQIKFEIDNLEMILYVNHEVDPTLYVVTEYRTFQDHNKPYLTLYRLNDGNYVKTKIKRGDLLPVNPFRLYSILQIPEFKMEYKMKKDADGNWQRTDELALIMEKYDVIRV